MAFDYAEWRTAGLVRPPRRRYPLPTLNGAAGVRIADRVRLVHTTATATASCVLIVALVVSVAAEARVALPR